MKPSLLIAMLLSLAAVPALAADAVRLERNGKLTFEFPELPETFFTQATGEKRAALLTAQLPENYTRDGRFPIFLFLNGGSGGRGNDLTARAIVGTRDFISVNVPLFKDKPPANPPQIPGFNYRADQIILPSDAAVLSRAYRVMLQKLFDTVPNIVKERSTLGGFSNGAHAAAALVAGKDEFILSHFTAFCFFEGGLALALNPAALQQPALKQSRFILLFGDADDGAGRKSAEPFLAALTREATAAKLDFTRVVMHGYGHKLPPEYMKLLGQWVRGEKIAEVK